MGNSDLAMAWSSDGAKLATISDDGVSVRRMDRGVPVGDPYSIAPDGTASLAWSPDGRRLAAGYRNGLLRVFEVSLDIGDAQLLVSLQVPDHVWSVKQYERQHGITPRRGLLGDSSISGLINAEPFLAGGAVGSVAWHPSGVHLATGCADGWVRVFEIGPNGGLVSEPFGAAVDRWPVSSISWDSSGALLAAHSEGGSLKIFEAKRLTRFETIVPRRPWITGAPQWSPHGYLIALESQGVVVLGVDRWGALAVLEQYVPDHGDIQHMAYSANGSHLATVSGRWIQVLEMNAKGRISPLLDRGYRSLDTVAAIVWDPTGHHLASASDVGEIEVFTLMEPSGG